MWQAILTNDIFITAVVGLLSLGVTYLYKFLKDKGLTNAATDVIRDSVQLVQDSFVHEIKAASEDGTLTKQEVQEALHKAWLKALELAKGPVKDKLLEWGEEKVKALIGRIVQSNK